MNTDMPNTPPVYIARAGSVRASVWETVVNDLTRHKITLTRFYRRKDEGWQRGRTFYPNELPAVAEAVAKAQQWIQRRQRQLQVAPEATPA